MISLFRFFDIWLNDSEKKSLNSLIVEVGNEIWYVNGIFILSDSWNRSCRICLPPLSFYLAKKFSFWVLITAGRMFSLHNASKWPNFSQLLHELNAAEPRIKFFTFFLHLNVPQVCISLEVLLVAVLDSNFFSHSHFMLIFVKSSISIPNLLYFISKSWSWLRNEFIEQWTELICFCFHISEPCITRFSIWFSEFSTAFSLALFAFLSNIAHKYLHCSDSICFSHKKLHYSC